MITSYLKKGNCSSSKTMYEIGLFQRLTESIRSFCKSSSSPGPGVP